MDLLGDRGVDPTWGADDWDDGRIDGGTGVVPAADGVIPVFQEGYALLFAISIVGLAVFTVQRAIWGAIGAGARPCRSTPRAAATRCNTVIVQLIHGTMVIIMSLCWLRILCSLSILAAMNIPVRVRVPARLRRPPCLNVRSSFCNKAC